MVDISDGIHNRVAYSPSPSSLSNDPVKLDSKLVNQYTESRFNAEKLELKMVMGSTHLSRSSQQGLQQDLVKNHDAMREPWLAFLETVDLDASTNLSQLYADFKHGFDTGIEGSLSPSPISDDPNSNVGTVREGFKAAISAPQPLKSRQMIFSEALVADGSQEGLIDSVFQASQSVKAKSLPFGFQKVTLDSSYGVAAFDEPVTQSNKASSPWAIAGRPDSSAPAAKPAKGIAVGMGVALTPAEMRLHADTVAKISSGELVPGLMSEEQKASLQKVVDMASSPAAIAQPLSGDLNNYVNLLKSVIGGKVPRDPALLGRAFGLVEGEITQLARTLGSGSSASSQQAASSFNSEDLEIFKAIVSRVREGKIVELSESEQVVVKKVIELLRPMTAEIASEFQITPADRVLLKNMLGSMLKGRPIKSPDSFSTKVNTLMPFFEQVSKGVDAVPSQGAVSPQGASVPAENSSSQGIYGARVLQAEECDCLSLQHQEVQEAKARFEQAVASAGGDTVKHAAAHASYFADLEALSRGESSAGVSSEVLQEMEQHAFAAFTLDPVNNEKAMDFLLAQMANGSKLVLSDEGRLQMFSKATQQVQKAGSPA